MNCRKCGHKCPEKSVFCPKCGSCLDDSLFTNKELVRQSERELKAALANLEGHDYPKVTWDDTADRYARAAQKLRLLCEGEEKTDANVRLIESLDAYIRRCQSQEFQIAFVGTIKAGKSTLINALLGEDLASTSVTPETAALTKFCKSERGYVRITFYSKAQWSALWRTVKDDNSLFQKEFTALGGERAKDSWVGHEEIKKEVSGKEMKAYIERWTSSKHVEHFFVSEVEVGYPTFPYEEGVVFIDTPGLDDAVRYRSDVTRKYIGCANAVLACVKSDALSGSELSTLFRIFDNSSYDKGKVFVLGTQWDQLNHPDRDWASQKEEWIKYLETDACYESRQAAAYHIIPVAAYVHNLCRDYDKLDNEQRKVLAGILLKIDPNIDMFNLGKALDESIGLLTEKANVHEIHARIEQDIIGKRKQYLLGDIQQGFSRIAAETQRLYGEKRKAQAEALEVSRKGAETIHRQLKEEEAKIRKINEQRENVVKVLQAVRQKTQERINALCAKLDELIEQ